MERGKKGGKEKKREGQKDEEEERGKEGGREVHRQT